MSSNLHVRRASEFDEIPQVAYARPASIEQLQEIWGALVHEVATVQAISTAAATARTDESRLAYLKLLEAETAEMAALVEEARPNFLNAAS
ncbi:hypothetical protein EV138_3864 [Kribbella voronezhensis]|uniref:Uncharacterized protein n=1 Tax=Kribbella voronezhensis TaxID=2512212 RepID=A0A4R7TES6_9ACTN|nr:hypothetical protein [Kribbella voronezhensis]TDU90279.1 hypothetical protein EV138_3864 [Kribbella voronezhensis]